MNNQIETTGRTLEEAIEEALNKLGIPSDEAEIEVLEEPSRGVFGIGSKQARVRVTALSESEVKARDAALKDQARVAAQSNYEVLETPVQKPQQAAAPKKEVKERPAREDRPLEVAPDKTLELALAFMEKTVAGMNIEATFTGKITDDGICVEAVGPNMGRFIGHRGETLDALQYLCNLAVSREGRGMRVWLDTEGYREKRQRTLTSMALRAADQVMRTGQRVALDPMSAADRRILHTALQNRQGIMTTSEGDEPRRYVVVMKEEN